MRSAKIHLTQIGTSLRSPTAPALQEQRDNTLTNCIYTGRCRHCSSQDLYAGKWQLILLCCSLFTLALHKASGGLGGACQATAACLQVPDRLVAALLRMRPRRPRCCRECQRSNRLLLPGSFATADAFATNVCMPGPFKLRRLLPTYGSGTPSAWALQQACCCAGVPVDAGDDSAGADAALAGAASASAAAVVAGMGVVYAP